MINKLKNHRRHQLMVFGWDDAAMLAMTAYGASQAGEGGAYPGLSLDEIELQRTVLEGYKSAISEGQALRPLILQEMGLIDEPLTPEQRARSDELTAEKRRIMGTDEYEERNPVTMNELSAIERELEGIMAGGLRKMTEEERVAGMTELQRKQYDITGLELERQQRALKGELPVTEATQKRYEEERGQFETEMSRRLGPGWKTSTPGIQAEEAFESRWGTIKETERLGQLERGTRAIGAQYGLLEDIKGTKIGRYAGFPERRISLLEMGRGLQQPAQEQRYGEYKAREAGRERRAGLLSDIGEFAGTYYGLKGKPGGGVVKKKGYSLYPSDVYTA